MLTFMLVILGLKNVSESLAQALWGLTEEKKSLHGVAGDVDTFVCDRVCVLD